MKKEGIGALLRIYAIASVVVIVVIISVSGYSQSVSDDRQIKTTRGIVTTVDWLGSVLMVNMTAFKVSPDTEIVKGASKIWFSELNVGDTVTISYYQDPNGALQAVKIIVDYRGTFPV